MLSQTIEYALRAMTYLATLPEGASISSSIIARETKVPQGYLSKVLRDLVVADLVVSQRGPNGGFTLARPASQITILDVVNAVEPLKRIASCPLGNPKHITLCPLHQRLDRAMDMVEKEFKSTTLAALFSNSSTTEPLCRRLTSLGTQ